MWVGPQKFIAYEFINTSPAVSNKSGSSNLDGFVVGGRTANVLWGVASSSQDSCVEIKLK